MDVEFRYTREDLWLRGILGFFIGLIVGVIGKGLALFLVMGMVLYFMGESGRKSYRVKIEKFKKR